MSTSSGLTPGSSARMTRFPSLVAASTAGAHSLTPSSWRVTKRDRLPWCGSPQLPLRLVCTLGSEPEPSVCGRPSLRIALLLEILDHARQLGLDIFVADLQPHHFRDLVHVHRGGRPPFGHCHLVCRHQKLLALLLRFVRHYYHRPPSRRFPPKKVLAASLTSSML